MSDASLAISKIQRVFEKNSPGILTAFGVVGVTTTAILAVKATPKAVSILDEREPKTKIEIVKLTWKLYIPTLAMAAVTSACIIGSNTINGRRSAALLTAYSLTDRTFQEYKGKVLSTIGEKKEQEIRSSVSQDNLEKHPVDEAKVIITGYGDDLFYDSMTGRYFYSNIEKVRQIQNDLNKDLISDMWVSLNSLFERLGLEEVKLGEELGWNTDNLIELGFDTRVASNKKPCFIIEYKVDPKFDSYRSI